METTCPALGIFMFIPIMLLGLAATAFWVWMLIDCLSNEPSEGNDKILWALVIVLTTWLGALLYFFIQRPKRLSSQGH